MVQLATSTQNRMGFCDLSTELKGKRPALSPKTSMNTQTSGKANRNSMFGYQNGIVAPASAKGRAYNVDRFL